MTHSSGKIPEAKICESKVGTHSLTRQVCCRDTLYALALSLSLRLSGCLFTSLRSGRKGKRAVYSPLFLFPFPLFSLSHNLTQSHPLELLTRSLAPSPSIPCTSSAGTLSMYRKVGQVTLMSATGKGEERRAGERERKRERGKEREGESGYWGGEGEAEEERCEGNTDLKPPCNTRLSRTPPHPTLPSIFASKSARVSLVLPLFDHSASRAPPRIGTRFPSIDSSGRCN